MPGDIPDRWVYADPYGYPAYRLSDGRGAYGPADGLAVALANEAIFCSDNKLRGESAHVHDLITGPVEASITITTTLADEGFCFWGRAVGACWHKPRRCRVCNPYGNPPKLCINGREYRRRSAARKRRRRG